MKKDQIKPKHILPLVFLLGFVSLITQIILLREFLFVFNGNELVIGIVLSLWMFITGLGAYIKQFIFKKNNLSLIIIFQIIYGALPVVMMFSTIWLRDLMAVEGVLLNIGQIIFITSIVVFPFCFLSGLLFVSYSKLISKINKENNIVKTYLYEILGSITGGLLFSFILVFYGSTFDNLFILSFISAIPIVFLSIKIKKLYPVILSVAAVVVVVFVVYLKQADKYYFEKIYYGQNIIEEKNSPYGRIVITENNKQKNYYENNYLLFSDNNIIQAEEAVHYTMLQHSNPKNVLLLSGGLSGCIPEILKYEINSIDYVELNSELINIGKKYIGALNSKKVNIINSDARWFIKQTDKKYDIILLNLPEPVTLQFNRFYTVEFFNDINKIINKDAVISFSLNAEPNYMSNENAEFHKVIYNSLKTRFKNIEIIPGDVNYFLASNNNLRKDIVQLYTEHNIENEYVNNYYLDDFSINERNRMIMESLPNIKTINRDLRPITFYNQLVYWLRSIQNINFNPNLLLLIFAGIYIFFLIFYNPVGFGMFSSAFTASFAQISLIFLYQIIFGFAYYILGVIFSLFMTGLLLGAVFGQKIIVRNFFAQVNKIQITVTLYSVLLIVAFLVLPNINNSVFVHFIIMLLVLVIAFLISVQFSIISKHKQTRITKTAATNYSADMMGGAFGAIVFTLVFIPLFSIINSCIIIIAMNIISIIWNFVRRRGIVNGV